MDIEKEIKEIKEFIDMYGSRHDREDFAIISNFIKKQKAELEKKDKIIELMAEHLEKHSTAFLELYGANKKDWIEYFTNKVEKEGK